MTAIRTADGKWTVVREGSELAGPFETSSQAWRRIDRYTGEPLNPAEKKSEWITDKILGGEA